MRFNFKLREKQNKQTEKGALYLINDRYSYALFNTKEKKILKYFEGDFSGVSIRNKTSKYYFEHYRNVFNDLYSKGAPLSAPVSVALSANDALIKIIDIPNMTTQEAKTTVMYNHDEYLPFSLDDTVFDIAKIEFPGSLNVEKRFVLASMLKQISVSVSESAFSMGYSVSFIEPVQISIERCMSTAEHNQYDSQLFVFTMNNSILMVYYWKGYGIFYKEAIGTEDTSSMIKVLISSIIFMKSRSSWGFNGISVVIAASYISDVPQKIYDALVNHPEFDNVSMYDPLKELKMNDSILLKDELIPLYGAVMR